jgi:hypothetical protein
MHFLSLLVLEGFSEVLNQKLNVQLNSSVLTKHTQSDLLCDFGMEVWL